MIRPNGHVSVSSSGYRNRTSLAGHDVLPHLSGLCRAREQLADPADSILNPPDIRFPKTGSERFYSQNEQFKRAREGNQCYCVAVQFHLFWLRRRDL
jgi:hypothetical protein